MPPALDDLGADRSLNSFFYPKWQIFEERVYVCTSTIICRSAGLNMLPANYGGWMGAFSSGRQCDCVYTMLLPSKTSHWHEKAQYQLAQFYVKFTLLPLELITSLTASYCIPSTLVLSHHKPTANFNSQPPVIRGLIFYRFCAVLVVIMVSRHRSSSHKLTSISFLVYQTISRSLGLSKSRANVCLTQLLSLIPS